MPRKKKEAEPTSWIVKLRCVVTEQVICEGCTREQAESDPYKHSIDEVMTERVDWEVLDVEPNL